MKMMINGYHPCLLTTSLPSVRSEWKPEMALRFSME
jgi:hypothetical protein